MSVSVSPPPPSLSLLSSLCLCLSVHLPLSVSVSLPHPLPPLLPPLYITRSCVCKCGCLRARDSLTNSHSDHTPSHGAFPRQIYKSGVFQNMMTKREQQLRKTTLPGAVCEEDTESEFFLESHQSSQNVLRTVLFSFFFLFTFSTSFKTFV